VTDPPARPQPVPLSDPSRDLADCPPVRRVIVIASQERSGSSLLARSLQDTGLLGIPDEYLLPLHILAFRDRLGVPRPSLLGRLGQLRRRLAGSATWRWSEHYSRRSLLSYLHRIAGLRTTPNGVLALKVQAQQLAVLLNARLDFDAWGPAPEFIALDRLDRVAQAVSHHRASQDRAYNDEEGREPGATRSLHYDEARLRFLLDRFDEGARTWERYFGERHIEPLRVSYEDLDTRYQPTM
jgi:LPS sulfotransferase NodH